MGSAVETGREQVIVLSEPGGSISSQVILGKERDAHCGENGGVDTDGKIADAPARNRGNDGVEVSSWEELVTDPEWNRNEETDYDGDGYDKVRPTGTIHVFRQSTPGNGL